MGTIDSSVHKYAESYIDVYILDRQMFNVHIYGSIGVLGVRCILQMYLITTTVHRAYVYTLSLPTREGTIALIRHTYCTPYMFNPRDKKRGYVRVSSLKFSLKTKCACSWLLFSHAAFQSIIHQPVCALRPPSLDPRPIPTRHHGPGDLPGN